MTASDYTLYVDISQKYIDEFEEIYASRLKQEQPRQPRGILFKRYIESKLRISGTSICRIDLVFNNQKMIELLEARGSAIKNEKFNTLHEVEAEIEAQKEY